MARVLVTDARLGSAVAIIRSLGRAGHEVVAADSDRLSPGRYSRYASGSVRYPSPAVAPAEMVETLLAAARKHRIDLIFPVTDDTILPLDSERRRFEGVCKLALPDAHALATARDKHATCTLAQSLGIPTPETALVATRDEAREQAARLGWPVVLKPRVARLFHAGADARVEALTVSYADSADALDAAMQELEGRCSVLLQEYCAGDAYGVELLLAGGRPVAAFQHRRLREVPITGGASSLRESVPLDDELYDYSVRLLAELQWTGLAMVEFKVGDGGARLMEINGRVWGSLPLAVKSGVDFPSRTVDLYLSRSPAAAASTNGSYAVGVRSRHLELEALWIASVLRRKRRYPFLETPTRREALGAAVRLLHPADGYDVLSRDDPRPGLVEIVRVARKVGRKVVDER